jgi:hypothetical protein
VVKTFPSRVSPLIRHRRGISLREIVVDSSVPFATSLTVCVNGSRPQHSPGALKLPLDRRIDQLIIADLIPLQYVAFVLSRGHGSCPCETLKKMVPVHGDCSEPLVPGSRSAYAASNGRRSMLFESALWLFSLYNVSRCQGPAHSGPIRLDLEDKVRPNAIATR